MRLPTLPIPEGLEYDPDKLPNLLFALGERPVLADACNTAKIHPIALEVAMRDDSELRQQIQWAMDVGFNVVEQRIASRALGHRTPKVDKDGRIIQEIDPETGETVIAYDETFSDSLLKQFAQRLRPDLYGDKVDVNHTVQPTVYMPASVMADEFDKMLAEQANKTAIILENGGEEPIEAEFTEVTPEDDAGKISELV